MGESCKDVRILKLININTGLTGEVTKGGIERGQCGHAWTERGRRRRKKGGARRMCCMTGDGTKGWETKWNEKNTNRFRGPEKAMYRKQFSKNVLLQVYKHSHPQNPEKI